MKEKLLHERALVTCIAMLFICIILKLFGVQWFDLNTDIPILQEIDNVIMNNFTLSILYSFVLLWINGYFVCIITTKISKFNKYAIPLTICCILNIIVKMTAISNMYISLIFDTLSLLIVCLIIDFSKYTVYEYIIVFVLNIFYQEISLFVRDLGYHIAFYGLITSILFSIDYYIMLTITYLYLKKGDNTLWSIFHHFGSYLATKLWKKRSENYSNKEGN